MAGRNIEITDKGRVVFKENETGAKAVSMGSPTDVTTDYTITLPPTAYAGTQVLAATTTGSEPFDVALNFTAAERVGITGINVLNHGVNGDRELGDNGDDTAAIVTAVDRAEASSHSGENERLIFPAGGYNLKQLGALSVQDCFDVAHSYWLEGAGMGMTNMYHALSGGDGNHSLIEHTVTTSPHSRLFVLRDMTFNGNGKGTESEALAAINLGADHIIIDNVEFRNFTDGLIRIVNSPKVVSITNCRFVDLVANEEESEKALIELDLVSSADCLFIFKNNHVVGNPGSGDGSGQRGVQVTPSATTKNVRCIIRDNYFSGFGNQGAGGSAFGPGGAIRLDPGCHDSVISNNVCDNNVHTAIRVRSNNNVEISNNSIIGESSVLASGDEVCGIAIDSDAANSAGLTIIGNKIVGTAETDLGILIEGDISGTDNSIDGVTIADNVIDGCENSISIDRVMGKVDITHNEIKNSFSALLAYKDHRHAVYLNDLKGASQVNIVGNTFIGSVNSGGAIHWDRSIGTHTDSEGHVVLKDNFFSGMGRHANWSNGSETASDMALVYIGGKVGEDYIRTFRASGNRYDFTDALAGTYGMIVLNVSETRTFDSILEFGAVGDGTTDCTMAIDRASLAAGAGGEIKIPSGTFLVSDWGDAIQASTGLTVSATNTCIQPAYDNQIWTGAGTITVAAGSNDVVLELGATINGTIVRGLTFLGDATNTGRAIRMVALSSGNHGTVDACKISLFGTGVSAYGPGSRVVNCNVESCKTFGIEGGIDSNGDELTLSNNTIAFGVGSATGIGVYVKGKDSHIISNTISNAAVNSISLGANSETITVQGNTINPGTATGGSATYNPIRVYKGKDIAIQGNNISGTGAHTLTRQDIYLASDSGSSDADVCHKCTISGNTITSKNVKIAGDGNCYAITITNNTLVTTQDPSEVPDSKGNFVQGIDFENYGGAVAANIADSVISGNVIIGKVAFGGGDPVRNCAINLGTGDRNVVMGNTIKNWNIGIHILVDGDNNHLVGNNLSSGVTTNVVNGGADNVDLVTSESGVLETISRASVGDLRGDIFRIGPQDGSLYSAKGVLDADLITTVSTATSEWGSASTNATLDITSSIAFVQAETDLDGLVVIKIDGKHTREAARGGNDQEALDCLPYDGMLLWVFVVGDVTKRVRVDENTPTPGGADGHQMSLGTWGHDVLGQAGSGANIFGIATPHDGDDVVDLRPPGYMLFRFEHDGTEGAWRCMFIQDFDE